MAALLALGVAAWRVSPRAADVDAPVVVGEARQGGLTIALPEAVADVRIRDARVPGRPIVLIDPGHGGRDPGAATVSGTSSEKQLTLAMAQELADLLEQRGRVRVALSRTDDHYLTLDQRAAIARRNALFAVRRCLERGGGAFRQRRESSRRRAQYRDCRLLELNPL